MTQFCRATSWLIVSCGGVGSRVPWRSWDNGGHHGWWVRGLASFHLGTYLAYQVSAVHQILSMQSVFNSYVDFGSEKSRARLYGQDLGSQMHHKRAISSPKKWFHAKSQITVRSVVQFRISYAWRNIRIIPCTQVLESKFFFHSSPQCGPQN